MSITVHCLVKNEENFIWYSLQSVLPYVDKIFVWDTGSTDRTVEIIKFINSPKIEFAEKGMVDEAGHTALRNEMIKKTQTDWFMILDGDEIWPDQQLEAAIAQIKALPSEKNCALAKFILNVGDIYHYSTWGKYLTPWGNKEQAAARFFRKVKVISWVGRYDGDTLKYEDGSLVVSAANSILLENYFFHCGILHRSSHDDEVKLGSRRPVNTYFLGFLGHGKVLPEKVTVPEVFKKSAPSGVLVSKPLNWISSFSNFWLDYLPRRL